MDRLVETSYRMVNPCFTMEEKPRQFDLFTLIVFLDAHHLVRQMLKAGDFGDVTAERMCVLEEAALELESCHRFLLANKIGRIQVGLVRTKQLGACVLRCQEDKVKSWLRHGIVSTNEAEDLLHPIAQALHKIQNLGEDHMSWMRKTQN